MPADPNNPDDLKAAATVARAIVDATLEGMKASVGADMREASKAAAAAAGMFHTGLGWLDTAVTWFFKSATSIVTAALKLLLRIQAQGIPEFTQVSAAALSEFLGVEIGENLTPIKAGPGAAYQAAQQIGDLLISRLEQEFAPGGTVSTTSGETAAKTFAGYNVNFAVRSTMISTLLDACSVHLLENFRELGVEVARNLGLGRLSRQALMPLIRNTISQPYDRQLRAKYRSDRMTEAQLVHAFNRGAIDKPELQRQMAEKGFRDPDIEQVLLDFDMRLKVQDVETLVRFGKMTEAEALLELQNEGMSQARAQKLLLAYQLQREDPHIRAYVQELVTLVRERTMTNDEFQKLLDRIPWTDAEKQWVRDMIGTLLEHPHKLATFHEVEKMFEAGIVDVTYVDDWFVREGFNQEDAFNLFLFMMDQVKTDKAKAAAAAKSSGGKPKKKGP